MEIWETNVAILGSDEELGLQGDGWMPFGAVYIPLVDDPDHVGFVEVIYRRKKEIPDEGKET